MEAVMTENMIKILASNVRIRRGLMKYTITDLSNISEISKTRIIDIESGQINNVSITTLENLADALNTDVTSLLQTISSDEVLKGAAPDNWEFAVLSTFYPSVDIYNHKISSLVELVLILPLIDPVDLFECLKRIAGYVDFQHNYIHNLLDYCWSMVPDSLAKNYVKKQLELVKERRLGNYNFYIDEDDSMYKKEKKAYNELINQKYAFINNPIFSYLDSSMCNCYNKID